LRPQNINIFYYSISTAAGRVVIVVVTKVYIFVQYSIS
jgi:hypothetical protein